MSHVATIDLEIRDLEALAEAAKRIGMEFIRDQKTYRWWGESVGDYPIPDGFKVEDLGICEHALCITPSKRKREDPYEIGVVRRRDGRPGFTLLWDFIDHDLVNIAGKNGVNLKREYAAVVARKQAMAQGFMVNEQRQVDGSIRMVLSR
jgi:hypothetical protein